MEGGSEDIIFVVANQEFVVRKCETDIVMKGLFKDSDSQRIDLDLFEVGSPEAFRVYLKYAIESRFETKDLGVLNDALQLVEKYEDAYSVMHFKKFICSCWEECECLNDIACFNFKADIWRCISTDIFSHIRSDLNIVDSFNKGLAVASNQESSVLSENNLYQVYSSSSLRKHAYDVLNGVLDWHFSNCGNETFADTLSLMTRLDFIEEGLGSQRKLFQGLTFKEFVPRREIEMLMNQTRAHIVNALNCKVYVGCSVPNGYLLLEFILQTWSWKEHGCSKKPIAEYYETTPDTPRPYFDRNYSYFCKANPNETEPMNENLRLVWQILGSKIRFQRDPTPVLGPSYPSWIYMKNFVYENGSIYLTSVRPNANTWVGTMVAVSKIDTKSPEPKLTMVGRTCIGGRRIFCQLLKMGDTLHGFLGRCLEKERHGLWHFSIDLTQEHLQGLQIKPLCQNLPSEVVPVAATISGDDILLMLSHRDMKNCLFALFDSNGVFLKVLGHLPPIFQDRDIEGRQFFLTQTDTSHSPQIPN